MLEAQLLNHTPRVPPLQPLKWTLLTPSLPRAHSTYGALTSYRQDRRLLWLGGRISPNQHYTDYYSFDLATAKWATVNATGEKINNAGFRSAIEINGNVQIYGGNNSAVRQPELYSLNFTDDLNARLYKLVNGLPANFYPFEHFYDRGEGMLVLGGSYGPNDPGNSLREYNHLTGYWTTHKPMPADPNSGIWASCRVGNTVYLTPTNVSTVLTDWGRFWKLNLHTLEFTELASYPFADLTPSRVALYAIGGAIYGLWATNTVEDRKAFVYIPSIDHWEPIEFPTIPGGVNLFNSDQTNPTDAAYFIGSTGVWKLSQ